MTPNQLTTLLAEPLGRQFDEPFKLMLFDRATVWYERLLRNSIQKDPRRRKEFFQAVVIPVEQVFSNSVGVLLNAVECEPQDMIDLNVGCSIVQTVLEVPKTLFSNGISYDYVGSPNGANAYSFITSPSVLRFYQYSKYSKPNLFYSNINNKIQIYDDLRIRAIRIDGVFLNLKNTHECNCSGQGLNFWETPLAMSGDILQQVIQFVSQEINPKISQPVTDEIQLRNE